MWLTVPIAIALLCQAQTPTGRQPAAQPAKKPPISPSAADKQPPAAAGQTLPGTLAPPKDSGQNRQPGVAAATGPVSLDLAGALEKAKAYNAQFQSAVIAAGLAREDRLQAKAA